MDIVEQVLEIIEESSQRCARECFERKRQAAHEQQQAQPEEEESRPRPRKTTQVNK